MTSSATRAWLPDVNVWLALCSDRHQHHPAAAQWFEGVNRPAYLCRITQMALLRLLTNRRIMGEDVLAPLDAIEVYRQLGADERVRFADEPANAEGRWLSLMRLPVASGAAWTDAWLAAFAIESGYTLVSFDSGVSRWLGLNGLVLGG